LACYATKVDNKLTDLMRLPVAHPAGKVLPKQIRVWRGSFFVLFTNRDVPATKVTNGFRPDWGAQIHARYRSVTGTVRLSVKSALDDVGDLVDENLAVA
jgi:transposase